LAYFVGKSMVCTPRADVDPQICQKLEDSWPKLLGEVEAFRPE